ncbi:MAG: DUF2283 domain-containing protein [Candidatus Bathyarchaeia archaeon]
MYKFRYDPEADVLTVIIRDDGVLDHAEETGDLILHVDKKGKPLFLEILNAKKIVPAMAETLTTLEATVQ